MTEVTQREVFDHVFGSGALDYPWYGSVRYQNDLAETAWKTSEECDGWEFVIAMEDPNTGEFESRLFNHSVLLQALHRAADQSRPVRYLERMTSREAQVLLEEPEHADLDASAADEILQIAAFGEVVYG